ncbi:MAG: UPF0182 family protein, partial [Synergistaceae bacterium]|nr:UPF0182 family protein [Synergistaceae bacterium]
MNKKGHSKLYGIIIALVVIAALFSALVRFITDLLWFFEVGYESVFLTKLFTQLRIGIPTFIIAGVLSFWYLMAVKKGYFKRMAVNDTGTAKTSNLIALGLSAAFAGLFTIFTVSMTWFEVLKLIHGTAFGIT